MKNVDATILKEKIGTGEIIIIDVRTSGEFSRGKIENSINIPLDSLENNIEKEVPNKNDEVYIYCLSGSRSIAAAKIMDEKGYKNVNNVTSGLLAWRTKGYPLVNR